MTGSFYLSRQTAARPSKRTTSKVTRKGQITIPARFRQENGIKEGSSVEITEEGQKLIVQAVPDMLDLVGCDKGKYDPLKLKRMLDESRKNWR
jgi:AbrB family looped-hinge helix DNA binding protein